MLLINRLNGLHKLLISIFVSGAFLLLYPIPSSHFLLHFLLGWDIFCVIFLVLNWITFFTVSPAHIKREAGIQNEGRILVFIIALLATVMGFLAVLFLLLDKDKHVTAPGFSLLLAFSGMFLSWFLVHTIFAVRYAHQYYAPNPLKKGESAGGLLFPEEKKPDFLDFAYFSFVIGMTFQVSDVAITSSGIRRLVLLHGLISFGFNTIIVALTINIIAGLSQ